MAAIATLLESRAALLALLVVVGCAAMERRREGEVSPLPQGDFDRVQCHQNIMRAILTRTSEMSVLANPFAVTDLVDEIAGHEVAYFGWLVLWILVAALIAFRRASGCKMAWRRSAPTSARRSPWSASFPTVPTTARTSTFRAPNDR